MIWLKYWSFMSSLERVSGITLMVVNGKALVDFMIESFSKAHENDNPPTPLKFKSAIQKNIKDFFASWKFENKALSNILRDIIAKSNSMATL
jgi:hypothetical protein